MIGSLNAFISMILMTPYTNGQGLICSDLYYLFLYFQSCPDPPTQTILIHFFKGIGLILLESEGDYHC
jgi:hypothetical protein